MMTNRMSVPLEIQKKKTVFVCFKTMHALFQFLAERQYVYHDSEVRS